MASMPCRTRSRMERAASPSFAGAYASLVWKRKGRQACSRTSPGAVSACTARAKVRAKEKEMEFAATTRGDRAPTATSADSCTGASFHRAALPERVGVGGCGVTSLGGTSPCGTPAVFSPEHVLYGRRERLFGKTVTRSASKPLKQEHGYDASVREARDNLDSVQAAILWLKRFELSPTPWPAPCF